MPSSQHRTSLSDPTTRLYSAVVAALLEPLGLTPDQTEALEPAPPPSLELGDLALPCFPLAKLLRKPPPAIAQEIVRAHPQGIPGDRLAAGGADPDLPSVEALQAAGPYVNLRFRLGELAQWLFRRVLGGDPPYGPPAEQGRKVVVEYSAPNTNKPLHLGHVRNNVLGMSLSNVLEAAGQRVVRVNMVNDRGIHICKTMVAYRRWGQGRTPEQAGVKPDHFVGRLYVRFDAELKREEEAWRRAGGAGDEEAFLEESTLMQEARECLRRWEAGDGETRSLWERMNEWVYEGFQQTYARMGCRFDRWYLESETYKLGKKVVEEGLERGVFYRRPDGSVWARLEEQGLQDKLVLRSDGTSVYITQDLGTAVQRFADERMDRSLYVVGSEQELHFRNLFAILKQLGHEWADRCEHVSYGLVNLPGGMGKLKSREGRAVDADTLLDELQRLALSRIEEAIAEGKLERDEVGNLQEAAERVGQAALKVYLLQVSAEKNIVYDPDATLSFTGDTGPAIQYSHARIHGILRKGLERGLPAQEEIHGLGKPEVQVRED
ncbi:MAG: arginine--tRNA ligase, partial [Candidatus Eisenbacteria bacterium]|nr:arginine--tRNA ligase [Candidatus Eisenbacteria bacterium]